MPAYKQMRNIFSQSSQKVFWIVTYSNVAGAFVGFVVGSTIAPLFRVLPTPAIILPAVAAGFILTWPYKGRALYRQAMIIIQFYLIRQMRPDQLIVRASDLYRAAPITRQAFQLTQDGRPVVSIDPRTPDGTPRGPRRSGATPMPPRPVVVPDAPEAPGGGLAAPVSRNGGSAHATPPAPDDPAADRP